MGVALGFFALSYYLMATLPGTRDLTCMMGANLTVLNIGFGVILSVMTGIFVAGFVALAIMKRGGLGASSATGGVGVIVGIFTVFCTICTLPAISLLGVSLSLSFFVEYNLAIKIVSVLFMGLGLFFLYRQLKMGGCLVGGKC